MTHINGMMCWDCGRKTAKEARRLSEFYLIRGLIRELEEAIGKAKHEQQAREHEHSYDWGFEEAFG